MEITQVYATAVGSPLPGLPITFSMTLRLFSWDPERTFMEYVARSRQVCIYVVEALLIFYLPN
jgi:hypothetical protein